MGKHRPPYRFWLTGPLVGIVIGTIAGVAVVVALMELYL